MKKYLYIFFIAQIISHISFSQTAWFWLNPKPQGNNLAASFFITNTTIISAGSSGTIIKSTDKGLTWKQIYEAPNYDYTSISFPDVNTGYICSYKGKVIKTTNQGETWELQYTGVPDYNILFSICFVNTNTGFACGNNGMVIKTTNGGDNWTPLFVIQGYNSFQSICFPNENTGYVCGNSKLAKTTNGGLTWDTLSKGSPNPPLLKVVYFINAQTGFISGEGGDTLSGIRKTTDGGLNWQNIPGTKFHSVSFANTSTGYAAGTDWAIYKTTNNGSNWFKINIYGGYSIHAFDQDNAFCGSSIGIYYITTNGGYNWTNTYSNILAAPIQDIYFFNDNTGLVCGSASVLKSTNAGENWSIINTGFNCWYSAMTFVNESTGFVCGTLIGQPNTAILYKTTNSGYNWYTQFINSTGTNFYSVKFINANTGYLAGDENGIFKTTNGGTNWTNINNVHTSAFASLFFLDENTGYACGTNSKILKTTNSGLNWISQYSGSAQTFHSIYFINNLTGFTASGISSGDIWKTTNGGTNWVPFNLNAQWTLTNVYFLNEQTGFVSGYNGLLYSTTNSGINWVPNNSNTFSQIYRILFTSPNTGYFTGDLGLIKKTTTGGFTFIKNINIKLPKHFILSQNYPNPFNPVTKIKFQISKLSEVKLIIYDVLGREIATLVNEQLQPGTYETEWDASNYPSGVYFYKLITSDYTETRKMVLVK